MTVNWPGYQPTKNRIPEGSFGGVEYLRQKRTSAHLSFSSVLRCSKQGCIGLYMFRFQPPLLPVLYEVRN